MAAAFSSREIGILVELGFEALHFLETLDEDGARCVALEIGYSVRGAVEALRFHEGVQLLHGDFQFLDDHGGLFHEPDFAGFFSRRFAREKGDGGIDGLLLLAEIEDVAVGLGGVEHAVGARERLNQAVVLEVLVHIERVQIFGIEAGEQHVHNDGDVDFLCVGKVGIGPLLVFDALLHVLIVQVELADAVVGAVTGVVVGEDGLEGFLLLLWLDGVVRFFLRQVFLNLLHVGIALGGRREDASDIQRLEVGVGLLFFCLQLCEQAVVFDSVIDGRSGEQGIEPAPAGGGVVLGEDGLDNGLLRERFARLGQLFAFRLEVIDMESQDVCVLDGVGDCVGVELLLEELTGCLKRGFLILNLHTGGVFFKDGRAGEAEELGLGEELLDSFMVLAELGAVALVEDEDNAFVAKRFELLLEGLSAVLFLLLVALTVFIQREAELLDGGRR